MLIPSTGCWNLRVKISEIVVDYGRCTFPAPLKSTNINTTIVCCGFIFLEFIFFTPIDPFKCLHLSSRSIFWPRVLSAVSPSDGGGSKNRTRSPQDSADCTRGRRGERLGRERFLVISWLASSREVATQVCPIKPSPVLKGPAVLGQEAAFMTQNRGDEPGSPPEASGSVYSV